jgi:hypothetical protein
LNIGIATNFAFFKVLTGPKSNEDIDSGRRIRFLLRKSYDGKFSPEVRYRNNLIKFIQIEIYLFLLLFFVTTRATNSGFLTNFNFVELEECEEFDSTKREAKFAFSKPVPESIQLHWTLFIHFPRGNKTYLFQAREENGLLQAYRATTISLEETEMLERATYFGTVETSPNELLTKAKKVPTGKYHGSLNNWQTWMTRLLDRSILFYSILYIFIAHFP